MSGTVAPSSLSLFMALSMAYVTYGLYEQYRQSYRPEVAYGIDVVARFEEPLEDVRVVVHGSRSHSKRF